jgi:sugar phosphate isomerase/epimerase
MKLSGVSDEAGTDLRTQIRAHRELGWDCLDLRTVDGTNVTSVSDGRFDRIAEAVEAAGMTVTNFASGVCCWGRSVRDDFRLDVAELRRAIPRMHRLGTRTIRVMSCPAPDGAAVPEAEFRAETFRRLGELARIAAGEGVVLIHEHVGSAWTGADPARMLGLVEGIGSDAFRLLFDMGNFDGADAGEQSWEAYQRVKRYVAHVHLKDHTADGPNTWFGEGVIPVRRLLAAMKADGYEGVLAMEPHIAAVHHTGRRAAPDVLYDCYLRNGNKVQEIFDEVIGK